MKWSIAGVAAALAASATALIPIQVEGGKFVRPGVDANDSGEEFTIVGIDYQPGGSSSYDESSGKDVLSDENVCLRDAFLLQQLGVNTIRVYTVNPWINHDKCMSIFNAVGIYVILDVSSPYTALSRDDPASSYNSGLLNRVFGVIDAFKGYPNLLGFFSGNEVVNDDTSAKVAPPYVRALQRDMKQYIKQHANRTIPVGYSAADDSTLRYAMWAYLQCDGADDGASGDSKSDFYGLNSYDWCSGSSDWQTSGYGNIVTEFANSSIPVFFSEYGCNKNSPRTFTEVSGGVYSGLLQSLTGGLVYEFDEEDNHYGLVQIQSNGSVNLLQDYDNLQKAYNNISLPNTTGSDLKSKSVSAPSCGSSGLSKIDSSFTTNFTIPSCPDEDMLKKGGGNQNFGQIVDLDSTSTNYTIYNTDGKQIGDTNIKVDKDNQINTPTGGSLNSATGSASGSGSSTASSSKKKGAAGHLELSHGSLLASVFGVVYMLV